MDSTETHSGPRGMTISEHCRSCADAATKSGWYDEIDNIIGFLEREMGDKQASFVKKLFDGNRHMLITSEIAESFEGLRKDKADDHLPHLSSVAVEMADTVIRIADFCGKNGIPLEAAIVQKMAYNAVRKDHQQANRDAPGGKKF